MPGSPGNSGRSFFTVDPRRAALIVIDMQNAFVAEGAPLETPGARTMLPRLEGLIRFAREQRIPLVWTQSDHRPPYGGLMLRKFSVIGEQRCLWQGQPSFEMYPHMLQPREGECEYRIVKHKYDAFFETNLDAILRYHHVETLIVTGTATNACCESTARSAFMRDYQVAFPSDANATFDPAMHEATLKNIDLLFGRVMTTAELLTEMEEALDKVSNGAKHAGKARP
ncbi:MAG TPA: isochorismatase family cysteine hydrolase [Candidatus Acidoferrum sp.]|nr:isochorismatase family cysteine hydrolase [Candidatus Acidoferrum sp.]